MTQYNLFGTSSESTSHKVGKKIAEFYLRIEYNLRKEEIKEEYPVILPSGKKRIIDVVGISKFMDKKIACEIGTLNGGSLDELYSLFDNVENLDKIENESKKISEILSYFEKIESPKEKDFPWLDDSNKENMKIKKILSNDYLNSYSFLHDDKWIIDEDRLDDFVDEEISFLYKKLDLSEDDYERFKRLLKKYYSHRLNKNWEKVNNKIELEKASYEDKKETEHLGLGIIDQSIGE